MDRAAEPGTLIRGLAETATRIAGVERQLSPSQLMAAPEPGAWSSNELLWHIRATADVYDGHITRILEEDVPQWRHVSPRARMKKSRYDELPFAESFAAFAQQRAGLVALLEGLPPEAWQRIALVRVDKNEWRLTLHERVLGMVNHEQIHCVEMEQAAAVLRQTG